MRALRRVARTTAAHYLHRCDVSKNCTLVTVMASIRELAQQQLHRRL